jgi:hypothetical protein
MSYRRRWRWSLLGLGLRFFFFGPLSGSRFIENLLGDVLLRSAIFSKTTAHLPVAFRCTFLVPRSLNPGPETLKAIPR